MSSGTIIALATAIPAILAAITALITALRSKTTATVAQGIAANTKSAFDAHLATVHNAYPIQPDNQETTE